MFSIDNMNTYVKIKEFFVNVVIKEMELLPRLAVANKNDKVDSLEDIDFHRIY